MDSHNFTFSPVRSGFGFSTYLDTSYVARSIFNRHPKADTTIHFDKIDVKHKIDQRISETNLVNHLDGYSKKSEYQIKSYNIMPISSTFLVGGYVGSKSQKENAHRTRINVQIQDLILSKLVDIMGNAVQNVTYSKELAQAESCVLNMTSFDERNADSTIGISKSIKEPIIEQYYFSPVDQSTKMSSYGKQSYADVTKSTMHGQVAKPSLNKLLEIEMESKLPKIKLVTQYKTNQLLYCKKKSTSHMKKQNGKRHYKPSPIIDISQNNHVISSKQNPKVQKHKDNMSVDRESSKLHIDLVEDKKSMKPTEVIKKVNSCGLEITDVNNISIPVFETHIDYLSDKPNSSKHKIDNLDHINFQSTVIINLHPSIKSSTEYKTNDGIHVEVSSNCDVSNIENNNISPPVSSKRDLDQKRNRVISECSVDSEDSFIVFTYDCDHSKSNHLDEEDEYWSDDSCFSDGYCDKDGYSHVQCAAEHKISQLKFRLCSGSDKVATRKKKVRFAEGKSLFQIRTMVTWNYAHRMARIGPWETFARDSARFKSRICRTATILNYILDPVHRQRIFQERFSSEL